MSKRPIVAWCSAVLLLLTAAAVAAAERTDGSQRTYVRTSNLRTVPPRIAETWVWELCAELPSESACRVVDVADGDAPRLAVEGTDRVHREVARTLARRDASPSVARSFQLTLLEAEVSGAARRTTTFDRQLGESARAALAAAAAHLPFDTFRVLDSGLLTTTFRGETRLAGPDGLQYFADLAFREHQTADGPTLDVQRLLVRGEVMRRLGPPATPGAGPDAAPQSRATETLLESSLALRPGETVVAGTSRLGQDRPTLVVLLSAIAP